jgi:alkanesulfonate monooxygenase SsuD/methylene tetrahydromethanopterin reductase-like flavin-dependent oxidoreductase (luciferase family)
MPDAERQPTVLGFALRDAYPWMELAGLARAGEELGYQALFLPEVGARDTLAALTGLSGETGRLLLGTGVVPIPARTPQLLAMAAATVAERSGGRLVLGLGTGPSMPGALDRLRSTVVALHAAFDGRSGRVGDQTVDLGLLPPAPPPIWIAALGPRATALAGEIADGVILNWCTPERVAQACEQVAEGAARVGRDPSSVTVAVYVRAPLAPGSSGAARAAAAEYGSYPAYARQFAAMGIDPGDPDAIVHAVMVSDPADARERLRAYRAAGAVMPVVYPVLPPGAPSATIAREILETVAPNPT